MGTSSKKKARHEFAVEHGCIDRGDYMFLSPYKEEDE